MRMTNKIMQNNSLYNINQTKLQEDKYNTQLTSQSKITRPSDDPVVAIRALRLRSNVSTVSQYFSKNSPDAEQWLSVTAQSLNTITDVLTNLYNQVQTGVNKDYTASDMEVLLTQVEAYTQEMYATGNQDYAGRYIFTGYRTDTALTVEEQDLKKEFNITEQIKPAQLDSFSYTDYSIFDTTTSSENAVEQDITNATLNRIRLSYNDLMAEDSDGNKLKPTITFNGTMSQMNDLINVGLSLAVNPILDDDGNPVKDADGNDLYTGVLSAGDITLYEEAEKAYQDMTQLEAADDETKTTTAVYYLPATGEILFSGDIAEVISDNMTDGGGVSVNYDKNKWAETDLSPVHYFDCTSEGIHYNDGGDVATVITYDVGYNQTIQVNTNAYEVFDPAISRDYDDLRSLVSQFKEIESLRAKYQDEMDVYKDDPAELKKATSRFESADKAYTYIRDAVSVRFGDQITRYQNYLDATNVAITKNGTRSTRLELIDTRLGDQQSTFKELQEENEGIDMTEVAVKLTSAEMTYDAALMATSKIMQNSLINYI